MGLHKNSIVLFTILALFGACSDDNIDSLEAEVASELIDDFISSSFDLSNPELSSASKEIVVDYLGQIEIDFAAVEYALQSLQSAIALLLSQTSEPNLELAKQAWLDAHIAYEQTTLHRYFAAQALQEADNKAFVLLQYQINHWPIIPGYIDYVDAYPDSGIVNDINVVLDSVSLRGQHGSYDVSEVTLGFHVIEFLLWGFNEVEFDVRPASDYLAIEQLNTFQIEAGYTIEQLANNRRRSLLHLVTASLLADFQSLQTLWLSTLPTTRARIESTANTELIIRLTDVMSSMLTEELLLPSLYPMLNGDFIESIQSPYSHSTQNSVSSQLNGLESLLLERSAADGTTLDVIFSAVSKEFSEYFYQNFDASKSCLVLLYSRTDNEQMSAASEKEYEIVECINLLTNMITYIDRLKFELLN
jgi:uncharacterized iron-regulated protein